MGISGIISNQFSHCLKANDDFEGSQIDLIINRNDQCINLCEVKYWDKPVIITKKYGNLLQERMANFRWQTGTKEVVFLTLITKLGIQTNQFDGYLIDNEIVLSDFY